MNWEQIAAASQTLTVSLASFLLTAFSVVLGLSFIIVGLKRLVDHSKGQNPHASVFGPVAINLASGIALLQLSFFVNAAIRSLFGSEMQKPSEVLAYLPDRVQGTAMLDAMIRAGAMWVSVIGIIAIIRGIVLWNALARGAQGAPQGAAWKGFWHIVFGVLAVNITGTVALFFGK